MIEQMSGLVGQDLDDRVARGTRYGSRMSKRSRSGRGRNERRAKAGGSRARRPVPGDLLYRYITPEEAFGSFPGVSEPLLWLQKADQETLLREVAFWVSKFDQAGLTGWKKIERDWVSETILEPHRSRLLGLLHGDRTLVSTQSLLIAAKRALTVGRPSAETDMRPLFMAAVSLQGGLGTERDSDTSAETRRLRLLTEIIRNQEFHRRPHQGMRIAQSQIRWRDIPGREDVRLPVAPAESFEQVTGVPLLDLEAAGFYLFAEANEHPGGTPTVAAIAAAIHWERDRLEGVLSLIASPIEDLAASIRSDERAHDEQWTFDSMRRFPVLRLDGDRILILSPHLVLERSFGWLPFFDMTMPEVASRAVQTIATRAKGAFRTVCEREVIETLAANVAGGRKRGRLFDGDALRAAYPTGQIADAAIAYGDEWVVVEVSSGQLQRDTVVGGVATALEADLERLIDEKVDQIESTIAHIRADPDRLPGDGRRRRLFVPVLVIAEGVPLNPLTHTTVMKRLADAGRLAGPDVEDLHILDTEDLYVAEGVVETDRLGLNELLDQHRHAGLMRRVDLRSWLAMAGRAKIARPERLRPNLDVAMDLITDNLGMDRDDEVVSDRTE